jgi:hypothetical protein
VVTNQHLDPFVKKVVEREPAATLTRKAPFDRVKFVELFVVNG